MNEFNHQRFFADDLAQLRQEGCYRVFAEHGGADAVLWENAE